MTALASRRHGVRRRAALAMRGVVLLAFAAIFFLPLAWLVLAPTKTDYELLTRNPFAFGSLHNVWGAWQRVDGFSDHIFRRWMANSLLYSLSAAVLTLVTAIPAGYGLVVGRFPGRKLILSVTLVALIVPPAALVLPIFLELNAVLPRLAIASRWMSPASASGFLPIPRCGIPFWVKRS
jgi:multiple sugar transport system permease protein